jgi:hypothetical protein
VGLSVGPSRSLASATATTVVEHRCPIILRSAGVQTVEADHRADRVAGRPKIGALRRVEQSEGERFGRFDGDCIQRISAMRDSTAFTTSPPMLTLPLA